MVCAVGASGQDRWSKSRRCVLAAAVAGLAAPFVSRSARAAATTWRIGHSAPTNFPLHTRLIEVAGAIAARSNGTMQLGVYGNSELGSPPGLLAQLRAGTLEAAPMTHQMLAPSLAVAALPQLGFAFDGYDRLWAAMDGDLGQFLRERIKASLGLMTMNRCWNFGFRQVTTSGKVIKAAQDLEGLRLRTPPDEDLIGLFQALKALPIGMPLGSLENALHTHALDGQEGVLPLVKAARLYQDQSACALTRHVWDGHWICISGKAWSNLPDSLQGIVAAAFDEAGVHQRQDILNEEEQTQRELEADGMKFNAVDRDSFRATLRKSGYYGAWRKKLGDDGWAALEKYSGRLA